MAAGDITAALLLDLGRRLEDTDSGGNKFPDAVRYDGLNYAQLRMVGLLHPSYLTEFENVKSAQSISAGSVTLATIDSGGIINGGNGVIACKVTPGSGTAQWATKTSIDGLRTIQQSGHFAESDTNPYFYILTNKVYFLLSTYTAAVADIYYHDYPTDIASGVDPVLNTALHPVLLDFAEAYCWSTDSEHGEIAARRAVPEAKAIAQIKILNGKV